MSTTAVRPDSPATDAGRSASASSAPVTLPAVDVIGRRDRLRVTVGALGLALFAVALLVLSRLANDPLRFPVSNVDVLGTLDYTDRDELRGRIVDQVRLGFYGLDVDVVREEVEALPWVASARVGRVWPGRLSIDVEEHEPAARWNDDALLSKRLVLFHPPQLGATAGEEAGTSTLAGPTIGASAAVAVVDARRAEWRALFAELPRLSGAEGRHADVFDDHRRYGLELARLGVAIDALEEDARRSQTLVLDDGVTVRLGYEDRELRLARFADVHGRLVAPLAGHPARFDMRYSNGFAFAGEGASSSEDVDRDVRGAADGDGDASGDVASGTVTGEAG